MEGRLRDTDGDLGAAAAALLDIPQAWQSDTKIRTPADFLIAAGRATGMSDAPERALGAMRMLGQPMWAAPQPDGWPDRAADWLSPEAMLRRADVAYAIAGMQAEPDPSQLAEALGPLVRPATLSAVQHAGSRREALALLLAAPEFQRR